MKGILLGSNTNWKLGELVISRQAFSQPKGRLGDWEWARRRERKLVTNEEHKLIRISFTIPRATENKENLNRTRRELRLFSDVRSMLNILSFYKKNSIVGKITCLCFFCFVIFLVFFCLCLFYLFFFLWVVGGIFWFFVYGFDYSKKLTLPSFYLWGKILIRLKTPLSCLAVHR